MVKYHFCLIILIGLSFQCASTPPEPNPEPVPELQLLQELEDDEEDDEEPQLIPDEGLPGLRLASTK